MRGILQLTKRTSGESQFTSPDSGAVLRVQAGRALGRPASLWPRPWQGQPKAGAESSVTRSECEDLAFQICFGVANAINGTFIGNILKINPYRAPYNYRVWVPCALQRRAAKFARGKGRYVKCCLLSQATTLGRGGISCS